MLNVLNNMNIEANAIALAPVKVAEIGKNNLEIAKYFYNGSKVHGKFLEINDKLEGLIKEFNPEKIKEVFYDLAMTDQDLYLDIIIAMRVLVNNMDEKCEASYIAIMGEAKPNENDISEDKNTDEAVESEIEENTSENNETPDENSGDWEGK